MPAHLQARATRPIRSLGVMFTLGAFLGTQIAPRGALAAPARTALLGLDAADSNKGREISDALADALDARNALFRAPLTFAEYRLMMSCAPDNNRCLGRAGEGFEAPQIMLGGLELSGDGTQVNLRLIKNRSGQLLAMERFVFTNDQLQGENLVTSADYMVKALFAEATGKGQPPWPYPLQQSKAQPPEPEKATPAPAPAEEKVEEPSSKLPSLDTPEPKKTDLAAAPKKRRVNRPRRDRDTAGVWKKVGLGASVVLAGASFGAAYWTHRRLVPDGDIRREILDLASASISPTDGDPDNDINPRRPENLCDIARLPREKDPSRIRHEEMDAVCTRGERLVALNAASLIAGGLFTVSSAVLLGLIIRDSKTKKRVSVSGGWTPGAGGAISTRVRF